MADLKILFSKEHYRSFEDGETNIAGFLSMVLPIRPSEVSNPENELANLLLSYHSDDGGAVTVSRIEVENASYDARTKAGKIWFKYYLAYHYACSYSEKDYEKDDKVDFFVDENAGVVKLTFLDLNTRSTAEEF